MAHHKSGNGFEYWIRWAKVQRYYLLNQWHYFKKPALKKQVKRAVEAMKGLQR